MSFIKLYNQSGTPSTPSAGIKTLYIDVNGNVRALDASGLITNMDNKLISSRLSATSGIANSDTLISTGLNITGGTITAGSLLRFTIMGTTTASGAGTQVFTIRQGTANTTADTALATVTVVSSNTGTGITFNLTIDLTVRTAGASGTLYGYGKIINQGTTGFYTLATGVILAGGSLAIDTTATKYLNVSYVSGSANCTTTFQNVIIEVVKQ